MSMTRAERLNSCNGRKEISDMGAGTSSGKPAGSAVAQTAVSNKPQSGQVNVPSGSRVAKAQAAIDNNKFAEYKSGSRLTIQNVGTGTVRYDDVADKYVGSIHLDKGGVTLNLSGGADTLAKMEARVRTAWKNYIARNPNAF